MGAPIKLDHQNLYLALFTHRLLCSSICSACRKQVISKSSDIHLLSRCSSFHQFKLQALHKTLLNRGSCHSPLPAVELVGVVSLKSCVMYPMAKDPHNRIKTKHKTHKALPAQVRLVLGLLQGHEIKTNTTVTTAFSAGMLPGLFPCLAAEQNYNSTH